jgi:hypothetical protein
MVSNRIESFRLHLGAGAGEVKAKAALGTAARPVIPAKTQKTGSFARLPNKLDQLGWISCFPLLRE